VLLRGLLAEIGRSVLFLSANLSLGLDAKVVVESIAVAGIGGPPKGTRQGLAVVAKRELEAVDGRAAMRAVGVVELGSPTRTCTSAERVRPAELSASAP